MNVEPIIAAAKARVEYRLPHDLDINVVIEESYDEIVDSISERVQFALESAMLGAQSALQSQAQKYIDGLKINDDLTIGISEEARHLEDGYGPREMLPSLTSGPKSKIAEDGSRYSVIPVGSSDQADVRQAMAMKAKDVISSGALKPATSRKLQDMIVQMSETLKMSKNRSKQDPKKFAVASSKQEDGWVHPGFSGVKQLDQINSQLRVELEESVVRILESNARRML